ncbi:MAG: LpqN/LpqT family lipoprotein [Actinomycetia bacterium]|nr:LpqN/LpqT family lipoprotein [Actinomycetes bacterium]MCH9700784.1 LpqN/LpqT family lipoprotein [Actinomycetes bacterium]MCH9759487.1 LpqN/LpqT family lipoprotein [Actinomycetes bacterium]
MSIPMRAGVIAIATVALGIGLSGCGSDTKTEESATTSPTSETTSEAPTTTTSAEAGARKETLQDYIKQNNITETRAERGAPGSPTIELPTPDGWEDAGDNTPEWAYGAIMYTGDPALAEDPPMIIAILSKLTGDVDQAKVLEYAEGEIQNLPEFDGPDTTTPGTLGGFDAVQISGTYTSKDGVTRTIAQKTVVIPGQDGLYVLQLNADGTQDQEKVLMDATQAVDEETTITT